ncbi:E3 ubiquitin-protein ligase RING1-like [Morella rubra]|uniref:E3 ubiquitin-protein ligase RING1-like n=1 Tax=Morella rubra TaxID=262757 RepID=A0A6A1VS05_9ROSI|nr:E3 ubiquitin-protein ligase RING1-like [Morella rubra]
MAPVSSESNFTTSSYTIDLLFDLDEALTLPEDSARQIAAQKSLVMNLPTVITTDVCSVCIESFRSGEGGKQVPCGHVYHANCIASWLSSHSSCPVCRREISTG